MKPQRKNLQLKECGKVGVGNNKSFKLVVEKVIGNTSKR